MIDLAPEQIRELIERFGSMRAAATAAMREPLFKDEFRRTGAYLHQKRDGSFGYLSPRKEEESFFWNLVWAAHARSPAPKKQNELDLGGAGYTKAEIQAANDLLTHEGRLVARRLEAEGQMSLRRALRFWHWFQAGAVRWSKERGLYAGPGFQWVRRRTRSGDRWTLVRTDS